MSTDDRTAGAGRAGTVGTPSGTGSAVGAPGIVLVLTGSALVVLAVAILQWYRVDSGADVAGAGFTFRDLQQNADQLSAPVAAAYFNWLAFALGVAVVALGILANVDVPGTAALRAAGFLAGAGGVVATYYALAQLFYAQHAAGGSVHGVLHNASFGVWCAAGGFLLAGIGALLGPRTS